MTISMGTSVNERDEHNARSNAPDYPALRRSWSWRRREGLKEYEGDIDHETLELLSPDSEEDHGLDVDAEGLSSQEAYERLQQAIREELALFNLRNNIHWSRDLLNVLKCTYHSSISWISLAFLAFEILAMFITYSVTNTQRLHLPLVEGILVLLMTVGNLFLCVREERLRRTEMVRCTQNLLDHFDDSCSWMPRDYVDPCIPPSPSISLTCTLRDKELVNVPSNLLVKGDIILLAPAHSAPAQVQQLVHGQSRDYQIILEKGELLGPPDYTTIQPENSKDETKATSLQPTPREKFVVTKTPFQEPLRRILKNSTKRPASVLENERHYIITTVIEKILLPVVLGVSLILNVLRYFLLRGNSGNWSEMFLLLQSYALLPIMPLAFPLIWLCLNMYGAARIKALFDKVSNNSEFQIVTIGDVLPYFWNNLMGDPRSLPHTANLLQGFGNVTVWCCVDKEGILSLPNPSVEKVFFLRTKKKKHKEVKGNRKRTLSTCTWESDSTKGGEATVESSSSSSSDDDDDVDDGVHLADDIEWEPHHKGHAEVYNMSTVPESEFGLQFDDIRWKNHLASLKPLGLNILLNSSCSSPVRFLQLADHTGHLSLSQNPTPLPSSRRCLCLLGRGIGFKEEALELFQKEQYIFAVQSNMNPKTTLQVPHAHPVLTICRERPVPHLACLVVKEVNTGSFQLLTQGSADMVMDACSDFWDGNDVCMLTGYERKKILDFYQRTNMSAYSVAFAYRPISKVPVNCHEGDVYLDIPPLATNWTYSDSDTASGLSNISEEEESDLEKSVDDQSYKPDIDSQKKMDHLLIRDGKVEDVESFQRLIGGQFFIGMVSLQYQAKKDIIPFVEDLNTAGVRFVQFSSENELRSRVFAERMGLETGWNCHISLSDHGGPPEGTSSATSSERIGGSCGDFTAGDEQADQGGQQDDEDISPRHVSWIDSKEETPKKTATKKESREECVNTDSEGLASSQVSAADDFWFFSNRAKLPRGIQNIRPHLQDIDNVPLLVPLFTDCTPSAVKEMIAIMQENGEVVNCAGSSLNCSNTDIFAQADLSIAIEPLFPQVCLKGPQKDFRSGTPLLARDHLRDKHHRNRDEESGETEEERSPLELSSMLNRLPCSLAFHRDINFKFMVLLQEARQICCGMRNCFTYMLSCQLMLSFVMVLSYIFLLPPPLTGLHLLWFTCVIIPLISLSLVGTTVEWPTIKTMMTAKNDKKFKDIRIPFAFYFCLGFLPTTFICCLLVFPLTLKKFCSDVHGSSGDCHFLFGKRNSTNLWLQDGTSESGDLALAQDVNAFFLVLVCVLVSVSFVHRLHQLWQKSPFVSKAWFCSASSTVLLQIVYFAISQAARGDIKRRHSVTDIPSEVITVVLVWPVLALFLSEILKRRYIKLWIRFQKRAKLKFGTKLGMNSPF